MTLTKAIELLALDLADPGSVPIEDLNSAQELGIEALKAVRDERIDGYYPDDFLLPGETKED